MVAALPGLLPTVHRGRGAAGRARRAGDLKPLVLAPHDYNDTHGLPPPGAGDDRFSAAARLLPFVEESELYKQIDCKKPVDDEANAVAHKEAVKTSLSPRERCHPHNRLGRRAQHLGDPRCTLRVDRLPHDRGGAAHRHAVRTGQVFP